MSTDRLLAATLLLPLLLAFASAAPTQVREDATAAAFGAGLTDGVVVTHSGTLRPGVRSKRLELSEAGVWSLAFGSGGVLYAGTGNDGKILAVRGEAVSVVHETGSILVAAMATGPDGEVYAGTVPDGRVYRIEPMGGGTKVTLLATLPDPNVWALDVDALGRVFAGTGPGGRVYRIGPDGRAEAILSTGDRDVLSVLVDGRGGLLVGTGGKGLLMHLKPRQTDYEVRVIHDFEEEEVRSLVRVGDVVHAGVNKDLGGGDAGRVADLVKAATAAALEGGRASPVPAADAVKAEGEGESPAKGLLRGALYRVDLEGGAELVLTSADSGISSLAVDGRGGILIAAGRGGRVFRYGADEGPALIERFESDHAGALVVRDGVLAAVGCSNAGAIHVADASDEKPPTYRSSVLDARFAARWGALTLDADGPGILVRTRTGNTAEPDATWSPWRELRTPDPARGEPGGGALRVASPRARYLLYELTWPRGSAHAVHRVALAYRCRNQRPRLSTPTLDGKPEASSEVDGSTPAAPATPVESGPVKTIVWKADAVDGDPLRYRLDYRRLGDTAWRPLPVNETTLADVTYTWDTTSVPDGHYVVRVTATDAPGNPDDALEATAFTAPFLVDNRKPAIEFSTYEAGAGEGRLSGTARDGFSRIASLEASIDGGDWMPVAPVDGLLDESIENFVIGVPAGLAAGSHSVMLRAKDAAGNVGVEGTTIRIE